MKKNLSKDLQVRLKGLGIYQLVGGIAGLGVTIWLIAQTNTITSFIFILFAVAIGLYSYSIYCGVLVLKLKGNGLNYSLINQYLQLINFAILGFGYEYVSGLLLSLGLDLTNSFDLKFNAGIMSTWRININSEPEKIVININIFALFVITFIDKLKKKMLQEEQLQIN